MGAAMFCLARMSSAVLYWVVSSFLARPVEWKCYHTIGRLAHTIGQGSHLFKVVGQETCQYPPPQLYLNVFLLVAQIKRMQQLEEENVMLKRGLEMVDMARDWYLRQLAAVQDKQRMLGKVNYNVSVILRNAKWQHFTHRIHCTNYKVLNTHC